MALIVAGSLGREFGRKADILHQQHLMHQRRDQKDRKARAEQSDNEFSEFADAALLVVSTDEIVSFRAELDSYDTGTIMALEENRIALERVREQMDVFLEQAHVLPDGRRVFKTEDGTQVFDEFGDEVDSSIIDPDDINDSRPRWEAYEPLFDEKNRLVEQQSELLDYQEKLDAARDRLDAGDLTRDEFNDLRDELKQTMPDAIRAHIPGMENDPADAPAPDAAQAMELDISEDMISTGSLPGLKR